ncbi:MAG: hypothetical protein J7639_19840 [Paenibacillaceae bacterium]|nr:hypothetical protein [Paenibacillaceae bacterium]
MFERTRRKLAWQFSLTVGLIMLCSGIFAYWLVQRTITTTENDQLNELMALSSAELAKLAASPKMDAVIGKGDDKLLVKAGGVGFFSASLRQNQAIWLVNAGGSIVLGPANDDPNRSEELLAPHMPDFMQMDNGQIRNFSASGGRTFRVSVDANVKTAIVAGHRLVVAQEITDDLALLANLRYAFAGFSALLLAIASAIGYWLSRRAMIPISAAYRRQEQFTSDASHELRTPLSILRSSVEVLEEQREHLPPFHRQVLTKMAAESGHLIRLVDNLLTLARSDNDRLELAHRTFSPKETVANVVSQLQPLAERKAVAIGWNEQEADNGTMTGDDVRLRQLLTILAENAIQYNREGGSVALTLTMSEKTVRFAVADSGIGIAAEHLPRIFERFYRVDQARSRRKEGTGLGLAIARQIAASHGGMIEAASVPGAGSTFTVTLPRFSD